MRNKRRVWHLGFLDVPAGQYIFSTQLDIQCLHGVSKEHFCDIEMLMAELEKNQMFEIVSDIYDSTNIVVENVSIGFTFQFWQCLVWPGQ
jgi:hypothetical protein